MGMNVSSDVIGFVESTNAKRTDFALQISSSNLFHNTNVSEPSATVGSQPNVGVLKIVENKCQCQCQS